MIVERAIRACSLALLAGLVLASCEQQRRSETSRTEPPPTEPVSGRELRVHGEPPRPGIRFDPTAVRPGSRVGVFVVDSIAAQPTVVDSSYVGVARFRGQVELSGWTLRNPDADSRAICFEADSASAVKLPRWAGDERRPWFCFENRTEAERALGPPSEGVRAALVIERFTIHRGLSDEVNAAKLVRVIRRQDRSQPVEQRGD